MGWLKNLVIKIAARKVAKQLDLQEGPMSDSKSWLKSKGVWTGVVTVLIGTYEMVAQYLAPQFGWNLPPIPGFVFTILGTLGIYSRVIASTTITK